MGIFRSVEQGDSFISVDKCGVKQRLSSVRVNSKRTCLINLSFFSQELVKLLAGHCSQGTGGTGNGGMFNECWTLGLKLWTDAQPMANAAVVKGQFQRTVPFLLHSLGQHIVCLLKSIQLHRRFYMITVQFSSWDRRTFVTLNTGCHLCELKKQPIRFDHWKLIGHLRVECGLLHQRTAIDWLPECI